MEGVRIKQSQFAIKLFKDDAEQFVPLVGFTNSDQVRLSYVNPDGDGWKNSAALLPADTILINGIAADETDPELVTLDIMYREMPWNCAIDPETRSPRRYEHSDGRPIYQSRPIAELFAPLHFRVINAEQLVIQVPG